MEVFLVALFFIATGMATFEATKVWKIKGLLGALGIQGGIFVGLFAMSAAGMAIPLGLGIPVVTGLAIFRKAQTTRMMRIADGTDEGTSDFMSTDEVTDVFD